MAQNAFYAWILSLMSTLSPPDKQRATIAVETPDEARVRYELIADAIVRNSFDPTVKPAFGGPRGRAQTAVLVTLMFWWESGFRKDVDLGLGRSLTARHGLNDFGHSWCMGQINLGKKVTVQDDGEQYHDSEKLTPEGWSGRDLVEDRNKCVVTTIRILRGSFYECRELPLEERLAAYIAGKCDSKEGQSISRNRMFVVMAKGEKMPRVTDRKVQNELFPPPVETSQVSTELGKSLLADNP